MSESERRSDGEVEDPWDEMRKREIERGLLVKSWTESSSES